MFSFNYRSKAPTSLMGVAKVMCQTPLFSTKTLAISSIQLAFVFRLTTTLCENGGTLEVMVRLEDTFVLFAIPHLVFEANCIEVYKVQPKCWHVAMAKLHDLPAQPAIDQTSVIPKVVVVHNEEGMV